MKVKVKKIFLILLGISLGTTSSLVTAEITNNPNINAHTKFYKNLAITQLNEYKNAKDYKIVINSVNKPKGISQEKNFLLKIPMPTLGPVLWTITIALLPVTERLCNRNDIDLCNKIYDHMYRGACHYPCITYGPEIITFNEKSNKLYLAASTTAGGSGGGLYFTFIADISKKEIKPLIVTKGPFTGISSPSGNHLLLYTDDAITIIKTENGESFTISDEINNIANKAYITFVTNIHWLNDTQFNYQVGVKYNKFQPSCDEMKENVYDIPSRKIIRTRIMAKTEFNSTPYTESN